MNVSTRFRYGLRAILVIAGHPGGEPVSAARIAEDQRVSPKYLEQILHRLLRAGLLASRKGARGGYTLGRPPEAISLLDVMEAVGDRADLTPCVSCPEVCERSSDCTTRQIWLRVSEQIRSGWRGITLRDLLASPSEGQPAPCSGTRVERR